MINEYGNGPLDSASVVSGRLKISDHRGPITDASFSPDGTAIATASIDGQVKFFQVRERLGQDVRGILFYIESYALFST